MKLNHLLSLTFLSFVLAFAGCSSEDDPSNPEPTSVKVTSVTVEPAGLTLSEGESADIVANVFPDNASNKKVTWKSSDSSVATVNNGKVTGIKKGTATITVTTDDGEKTATCQVVVDSYTPDLSTPFTIASIKEVGVSINREGTTDEITLEYRTKSTDWEHYDIGTLVNLSANDFVQFRAGDGGNATFSNPFANGIDNGCYCVYSDNPNSIVAYGNIMSLVDKTCQQMFMSSWEDGINVSFYRLFYGCKGLVDASKLLLPAEIVPDEGYGDMFGGCTNLVNAPELPADLVGNHGYCGMFGGCTNLVNAPDVRATILCAGCYTRMFCNCTSLVNAPALPAVKLAESCYYRMFEGCTSLVNAPELPAGYLEPNCYEQMFDGCTSLVKAPVLPAASLKRSCYKQMFRDCSSLSYLKAMFTELSSGGTYEWVKYVKNSGTFVKSKYATWDKMGEDGVPSGWTIETE